MRTHIFSKCFLPDLLCFPLGLPCLLCRKEPCFGVDLLLPVTVIVIVLAAVTLVVDRVLLVLFDFVGVAVAAVDSTVHVDDGPVIGEPTNAGDVDG